MTSTATASRFPRGQPLEEEEEGVAVNPEDGTLLYSDFGGATDDEEDDGGRGGDGDDDDVASVAHSTSSGILRRATHPRPMMMQGGLDARQAARGLGRGEFRNRRLDSLGSLSGRASQAAQAAKSRSWRSDDGRRSRLGSRRPLRRSSQGEEDHDDDDDDNYSQQSEDVSVSSQPILQQRHYQTPASGRPRRRRSSSTSNLTQRDLSNLYLSPPGSGTRSPRSRSRRNVLERTSSSRSTASVDSQVGPRRSGGSRRGSMESTSESLRDGGGDGASRRSSIEMGGGGGSRRGSMDSTANQSAPGGGGGGTRSHRSNRLEVATAEGENEDDDEEDDRYDVGSVEARSMGAGSVAASSVAASSFAGGGAEGGGGDGAAGTTSASVYTTSTATTVSTSNRLGNGMDYNQYYWGITSSSPQNQKGSFRSLARGYLQQPPHPQQHPYPASSTKDAVPSSPVGNLQSLLEDGGDGGGVYDAGGGGSAGTTTPVGKEAPQDEPAPQAQSAPPKSPAPSPSSSRSALERGPKSATSKRNSLMKSMLGGRSVSLSMMLEKQKSSKSSTLYPSNSTFFSSKKNVLLPSVEQGESKANETDENDDLDRRRLRRHRHRTSSVEDAPPTTIMGGGGGGVSGSASVSGGPSAVSEILEMTAPSAANRQSRQQRRNHKNRGEAGGSSNNNSPSKNRMNYRSLGQSLMKGLQPDESPAPSDSGPIPAAPLYQPSPSSLSSLSKRMESDMVPGRGRVRSGSFSAAAAAVDGTHVAPPTQFKPNVRDGGGAATEDLEEMQISTERQYHPSSLPRGSRRRTHSNHEQVPATSADAGGGETIPNAQGELYPSHGHTREATRSPSDLASPRASSSSRFANRLEHSSSGSGYYGSGGGVASYEDPVDARAADPDDSLGRRSSSWHSLTHTHPEGAPTTPTSRSQRRRTPPAAGESFPKLVVESSPESSVMPVAMATSGDFLRHVLERSGRMNPPLTSMQEGDYGEHHDETNEDYHEEGVDNHEEEAAAAGDSRRNSMGQESYGARAEQDERDLYRVGSSGGGGHYDSPVAPPPRGADAAEASRGFLPQPPYAPSVPRTSIEIAPGMFKELRGSEETWNALRTPGQARQVHCLVCSVALLCIANAELVICPNCRSLTPLDHANGTLLEEGGGGGGVGLGIRAQDVPPMHELQQHGHLYG